MTRSSKFAVRPRNTPTIPAFSTTTNAVLKGGSNTKYDRARAAAQAVAGELFKPTVAAAAREFKTTEYLVRLALLRVRIPTPAQAAVVWWDTLPNDARDSIIRARLNDVWSRFDRITARQDNAAA